MDVNYQLEEIEKVAQTFLSFIGSHKLIAFYAPMGSGKTTFIQAVCKQLGVGSGFGSPTFSIINEYTSGNEEPIYHIDLYRMKDAREVKNTGAEDCFFSGDYCFVEWPENAFGLLPDNTLHCYITLLDNNSRNLKIKL